MPKFRLVAAAMTLLACAGWTGSSPELAAADPTFSPAAGTYGSAQTVTITTSTPGATIHCTTDGSTPTAASPACGSPVAVSAATILKAIAIAPGHRSSGVATASYRIEVALPAAATPTFSPGTGSYASAQTVTISSATPGATIHCTGDGSAPTAASPSCDTAITLTVSTTLNAIATAAGYGDSGVATASYTIELVAPLAATPTFSPDPGTYTSARTVTISSATPGATIHCTVDGTTPTAASPACPAPVTLSASTTLKAIATATGHRDSGVATGTYVIEPPPAAATPGFSPGPGTYTSAQTVTIASATPGATIHCTQDGSVPTAASPACSAPISVSTSRTIRAIATATGYTDSAVGTATYVIQPPPAAATPGFSPGPGTYTSAQTVTIASATPGATIHCTQDGSVPTAASPACSAPISVSTSRTIRAIATATGYTGSAEASATYTIEPPPPVAATPAFSPGAGTYASAQTVTITSATPGATIHCTQDGSAPTAASPTCAAAIAVSTTTTIRAIATAAGYTDSAEASATYTIGGANATLVEKLQALSTKRQLFAHQSVGATILRGNPADGSGGLSKILADNPSGGVSLVVQPSDLRQLPAGRIADFEMATANGYPVEKINEFNTLFRTTFGGQLDYAGFKFCFADINEGTSIAPIWTAYQSVMDALEADFPGRVIYWTGAIGTADATEVSNNQKREQLNDYIRGKYGPTGRVFDLARMESTSSSNQPVTITDGRITVPAMANEWSGSAQPCSSGCDAHPNNTFTAKVANAYIDFVYAVATR